MIKPQFLKKGDKIAIVSIAGKIAEVKILNAIKFYESWGLDIVLGKSVVAEFNQFAGTDEQRIADFQKMLNDNSIKAIFSSRGGYGSARILDKIDWKNFIQNPKWIVGYSDITAVHAVVNKFGIASIHGNMPTNFPEFPVEDNATKLIKSCLFGEKLNFEFNSNKLNKTGNAKGILIGGNLSILYSLRGTKFDVDYSNKILFIEDLNEYLYHLDRMMMNFKLGGIFSQISGLIVGAFSDMKDSQTPFGKNANEIIFDFVKDLNIPVCFDFSAGHIKENNPLILGNEIELIVENEKSQIIF
jgi:muramoyltetrapeptide carboxypeptidase